MPGVDLGVYRRQLLERFAKVESSDEPADEKLLGLVKILLRTWRNDPALVTVMVREVGRSAQLASEVRLVTVEWRPGGDADDGADPASPARPRWRCDAIRQRRPSPQRGSSASMRRMICVCCSEIFFK